MIRLPDGEEVWIASLGAEQTRIWKKAIESLNLFLKKETNKSTIADLFASGLVEPLPISFNEFQDRLKLYLPDDNIEVLLNSVANHNVDVLSGLGASEDTMEFIGKLARQYSSVFRRAYSSWLMTPLTDWYRIVTEIVLRDRNVVFLKHQILKHDGSRIEYSGDIPSSFLMAEHIIRQIDRAIVVLGKEAVLGNVNPERLKTFSKKVNNLVTVREEVDSEIDKIKPGSEEDEETGS